MSAAGQTVYVAIYGVKHEVELLVFATPAGAEAWRQDIADTNWREFEPDEERPTGRKEMADYYFQNNDSESFEVRQHGVKPDDYYGPPS